MGISASRTRSGMGPATRRYRNESTLQDYLYLELTLAHVAVTGDRATFSGRVTDSPCRQTNQTDAIPQLRLAVQLEQRDIIVQRLAVVIVVNVCGGHTQCLGSGTAVLAGQIVIAHAHIDRIAGTHNAAEEMQEDHMLMQTDQQ